MSLLRCMLESYGRVAKLADRALRLRPAGQSEGYLIAFSDCEANKSLNSDNPGNVRLENDARLRDDRAQHDAGHALSGQGPGRAGNESRWVAIECGPSPPGRLIIAGRRLRRTRWMAICRLAPSLPRQPGEQSVASWQPGFCATGAGGQGGVPHADRRPARRHAILDPRHLAGRPRRQGDLPLLLRRGAPVGCAAAGRGSVDPVSAPCSTRSRSHAGRAIRTCTCTNGPSTALATRTDSSGAEPAPIRRVLFRDDGAALAAECLSGAAGFRRASRRGIGSARNRGGVRRSVRGGRGRARRGPLRPRARRHHRDVDRVEGRDQNEVRSRHADSGGTRDGRFHRSERSCAGGPLLWK